MTFTLTVEQCESLRKRFAAIWRNLASYSWIFTFHLRIIIAEWTVSNLVFVEYLIWEAFFSQIGRSADSKIDFVVTDTAPGNKRRDLNPETQKSTISRYACRIVIDREPPYTARVFAAGFDKSSNIFLGVSSQFFTFSKDTSVIF